MAIIQEFDLNMIPDSAPVVVHVDQYDKGTGRLVAHLLNGDVAYTPASGATAKIQGTKPDKKGFSYSATISGSQVTANLTDQMTAVPGRTKVNLVISEGSTRTGTFVFWMDVQATGLADEVDISETVLPEYISGAQTWADIAKSWAVGPSGAAQSGTDTNNARYWAEHSGGGGGGLGDKVSGTVSGNTLTLTGTAITATAAFTGPYIQDVLIGVQSVVRNGNTLTYTLTDNSANGKKGFVYAVDSGDSPTPGQKTLSSIAVTTPPTKTTFNVGDELDLTGIVVTATYSDGTTANVTSSCTSVPAAGSVLSNTGLITVTLSYTEGGETKTATTKITVQQAGRTLVSLVRDSFIDTGTYLVGTQLDTTGLGVSAIYSDGTSLDVSDLVTTIPANGSTFTIDGYQELTAYYTEGGVTESVLVQMITVDNGILQAASVSGTPQKTSYRVGDSVDLTGVSFFARFTGSISGNTYQIDIKDDCVITPPEGTVVTSSYGSTLTITATWEFRGQEELNQSWTFPITS